MHSGFGIFRACLEGRRQFKVHSAALYTVKWRICRQSPKSISFQSNCLDQGQSSPCERKLLEVVAGTSSLNLPSLFGCIWQAGDSPHPSKALKMRVLRLTDCLSMALSRPHILYANSFPFLEAPKHCPRCHLQLV